MQVHFTFRNFEASEGIKNYADDKVGKLRKYLQEPVEVDFVLAMEKHLHRVELSLRSAGERYAAHVESEDMYASIDLVVDKVVRQIRDAKGAMVARKRQAGPPPAQES